MLWEKDSGIVNVYKDTIPRFHRDPSKKKKKELEMGSVSPQSSLTDCCSNWCGGIHKRCRFVKEAQYLLYIFYLVINSRVPSVKDYLTVGVLIMSTAADTCWKYRAFEVFRGVFGFWGGVIHSRETQSEKLMIKFNKNGQGEEKILLNMNCRFMLLITKMENH